MFKEVHELKIVKSNGKDAKEEIVVANTRTFLNVNKIDGIQEEKTDNEKYPVVYVCLLGKRSLMISQKDFMRLIDGQQSKASTAIMPDGSFKTV